MLSPAIKEKRRQGEKKLKKRRQGEKKWEGNILEVFLWEIQKTVLERTQHFRNSWALSQGRWFKMRNGRAMHVKSS